MSLMKSCPINRNALRASVVSLLIASLFLLFVNGPTHSAVGPQIDDHFAPSLISVGGSGESSSPDPSIAPASLLVFPGTGVRATFSAGLDFIQPPLRLLSYPLLPQAPPHLV